MAQAFYEDVQRRFDFVYTTIQRLRDEGISSTVLSDTRAQQVIRQAGRSINRVTGQWFLPLEYTARVSVPIERALLHLDEMIPILDVRSLKVDRSAEVVSGLVIGEVGDQLTTIPSNEFRIDDRFIEFISYHRRTILNTTLYKKRSFPAGTRNVVIDGTFGWVERRVFSDAGSRTFSSTTTSDLSSGATTIPVADVSGFRVRDVVIVRNGSAPANFGTRAIVSAISSPLTLEVDPITLVQACPSGPTVITYGQVPEEVEMAAVMIVNSQKYGIATSSFANSQVRGRILSETTDNYSYRLESSGTAGSSSSGEPTTGVVEADRILAGFSQPPYVGSV